MPWRTQEEILDELKIDKEELIRLNKIIHDKTIQVVGVQFGKETRYSVLRLDNTDNELLAIAKTAPPVKKNFDTEKVFAVRLQY